MDLIASFSSKKIRSFHFFNIQGLFGQKVIPFLADTGAACPVIGLRNFFSPVDAENFEDKISAFERVLRDEIDLQHISARTDPLKTANSQHVTTYPCVCANVSIGNIKGIPFYFDISFDSISTPLLGSSFIDDCAYNHAIGGFLNITGIKDNAGFGPYEGRALLNFDRVVDRYLSL